MNPRIARRVLAMFSKMAPVKKDYGLTGREQDVLELMVKGQAKKQIADQLGRFRAGLDQFDGGFRHEALGEKTQGAIVHKTLPQSNSGMNLSTC